MCLEKMLKPDLKVLSVAVVLAIVFIWVSAALHFAIFPCKVQAVVPNPAPAIDSSCPLLFGPYMLTGSSQIFTETAYLMMFVLYVLLPYVLAVCISGFMAGKKK